MTAPIRVAIVGGGCAGIATAWQISEFVALSKAQAATDRKAGKGNGDCTNFQITVYEQSWRLGGKGASGRDGSGRIREHGLHIWLGFYENAFAMMRHCYDEVRKAPWGPECKDDKDRQRLPHESFDDAFFPEPHIGVATKNRSGQWEAWSGMLPPMKGLPGTELDDRTNPFTLAGYLARCIGLSKALIHSVVAPPSGVSPKGARSTLDESIELDFGFDAIRSPGVVIDRMAKLLRVGTLTTAAGVLQGATILENWLRERDPAPQFTSTVLAFIEALAAQTRRQLTDLVGIDEPLRRKTEIIDLIMTIVVGLYRDRVLFDSRGLDAINHIDCKDWLIKHGAMRSSVESPFVTGLYDLAFCYREGDRNKPALAAGQALRGALRMFFTYRGALFWRMRSGMGDTVFAPLYRVLKDRGVDFKFMHQLEDIRFVGEPQKGEPVHVASMRFGTPGSAADLDSFQPLDDAGCWYHERPAQFAQADTSSVTLNYEDKEFDVVVFAMGIDDFRVVCQRDKEGLFKKLKRWNEMQKHVKTVGTQAAQVWLDTSVEDLGWRRGSALVSALDHPFESWADMTHTFAAERAWRVQMGKEPDADQTRSVSYFVGLLSDADIKAKKCNGKEMEAMVRNNLQELLVKRVEPLWPDAFMRDDKGDLESTPLDHLVGENGQLRGSLALDAQHVQANFLGSDRYTLALPGSLEHRISPLDASVINMTIAGDWTECGFNEGCIEAAVMSGMLASHAICGFPALEDIVGYDHP
jgi:uncharacterized protein with NAD-binding domain and iron-sulfur cluster